MLCLYGFQRFHVVFYGFHVVFYRSSLVFLCFAMVILLFGVPTTGDLRLHKPSKPKRPPIASDAESKLGANAILAVSMREASAETRRPVGGFLCCEGALKGTRPF